MNLFTNFLSFFKSWGRSNSITNSTITKKAFKRALCVGINNYPGSANDLKGCVNDAKGWIKILRDIFGFIDIKHLLDQEATRKNVKVALTKLVNASIDGDEIVWTYSGHGTTTIDHNGDEADGKDEAICLYDGLMVDDEIRNILNKLSKGVKFTFISDSCHSGTVTRSFMAAINNDNPSTPRYMPPEDELEAASLNVLPVNKAVFMPQENMQEILISGCKSTEYSYDANFNGKSMGAFSHYALVILRDNPKITYADFYDKLRDRLPSSQYPQTPQLEGSDANKNSLMFN